MVPAHHLAQEYVDAYLEAAELGEDRKGPLFRRCAVGRQDRLEDHAMSRATSLRMIKRRRMRNQAADTSEFGAVRPAEKFRSARGRLRSCAGCKPVCQRLDRE